MSFGCLCADKFEAGNYCEPSMLNIPESSEGVPHPSFNNPTYCDTATSPQNAERDFSNPLYTESSDTTATSPPDAERDYFSNPLYTESSEGELQNRTARVHDSIQQYPS